MIPFDKTDAPSGICKIKDCNDPATEIIHARLIDRDFEVPVCTAHHARLKLGTGDSYSIGTSRGEVGPFLKVYEDDKEN